MKKHVQHEAEKLHPQDFPLYTTTMCNFGAKNKKKALHPDASNMQHIQLVGPVLSYKINVKHSYTTIYFENNKTVYTMPSTQIHRQI